MTFIPSRLIEASNGVIMVLLAWFLFFMATHFVGQWKQRRSLYAGRWGSFRTARRVYDDCGSEIALTVLIVGFELRTVVLWAARHADNHQHDLRWLQLDGSAVIMFGTAMVIIGAMCWNRIMTPFRCSPWVWIAMAASSFVFGVGMAIY